MKMESRQMAAEVRLDILILLDPFISQRSSTFLCLSVAPSLSVPLLQAPSAKEEQSGCSLRRSFSSVILLLQNHRAFILVT